MALSITLDPSHRRLQRPRLGLFVQGQYEAEGGGYFSGWSRQLLENVWQEPVGGNLMLQPRCLDAEWETTFTGEYARLGFADFGLTENAGGWHKGATPTRMVREEGTATPLVSTATFGGDRGWYLSYFGFDGGTGERVDLEFGIGASGSASDPACRVALQFRTGGRVQVNSGGVQVDQGNVGGRQKGFNEILIVPMNVRELLVYSLTTAQGFIHVFDDVDVDDPFPRILPDEPVWVYKPEGSMDLEIAPLRFHATGRAFSSKQAFAEPPGNGETAEPTEGFYRADSPGTSVATAVTTLDGTPYAIGAGQDVRIKVELTGSGTATPFVHAAIGGFAPKTARTAAAPVELRERAMRVRLEVPESAMDVRASFSVLGREIGVDDALWDLQRLTNVPLDLSLGDLAPFFRGQSLPTPTRGAPDPRAYGLDASFRDEMALLETPRHRDPYPYDDLLLDDALRRALRHGGADGDGAQIETTAFRLPLADSPASGDWTEIARSGDVPADLVRRWLETYASTWIYGYFPGADGRLFRAGSPEWFGTAPMARLYPSYESAIADGVAPEDAPYRLYKDFEETRLQIEANDIRVSGWDARLRRHIQARYFDAASSDPTTARALRPNNWEGLWLPFALFDRRINDQATADRACGILAGRLARRRVVCSFSTELVRRDEGLGQPLWRGDVVELVGRGIYRLNTLSAEWTVSEPDGRPWGNPRRRCRTQYTAVKGAGSALGIESLYPQLHAVKGAHEEWGARKRTLVRPSSDFLRSRPVTVQTSAPLLIA